MRDPHQKISDTEPEPQGINGRGCMVSFVLTLGVYQILFAYRVLIDNGINADAVQFPLRWQAGIAVVWGVLFAYTGYRLIRKRTNALRQSIGLVIAFTIINLLQTIWFVQADYERNRIAFQLVITIVILIMPALVLWQQQRDGAQHK
ncbi:MAG: hypothetical protein ACFE0Q_15315 [Anaerolineae bacterium]